MLVLKLLKKKNKKKIKKMAKPLEWMRVTKFA
jgi:hypothetical protein